MTVGEMKEELDGFGDHITVKVVKNGRDRDTFFTPVQLGLTETPDGESVVQIEIDQAD